jgi:hypothetical protein
MTGFEHVVIDADVRAVESFLVKARFARGLNSDEQHQFHVGHRQDGKKGMRKQQQELLASLLWTASNEVASPGHATFPPSLA